MNKPRSYKNCFEKDYTLVVFQTPLTGEEVFRQMDHCSNNFIEKFLLPHPSNSQPKILPCPISDFDPLYATLTRHKKCALVGNSGILLQSKCGRTIDSFDFVIRGNMAPVIEYESYVGTKTDMMLLNDVMINVLAEVLSRGPRDDREIEIMKTLKHFRNTILWYPKNTEKHISQLKSIVRGLKKNNFSIHIAYSLIDIYRNIKWKYNMWRYPSSGLYMLALAESICEEITLFGFYPFERDPFDKEIRSHYYDKSFTRNTDKLTSLEILNENVNYIEQWSLNQQQQVVITNVQKITHKLNKIGYTLKHAGLFQRRYPSAATTLMTTILGPLYREIHWSSTKFLAIPEKAVTFFPAMLQNRRRTSSHNRVKHKSNFSPTKYYQSQSKISFIATNSWRNELPQTEILHLLRNKHWKTVLSQQSPLQTSEWKCRINLGIDISIPQKLLVVEH
ncbi:alpha 2,8-sialyltransferase ST8Sia VI [Apostichopus japonicus]|uniref:Alpha 2,8-sialyltransferase ST8Sia VI n=1 Tax=Stichopus japonicus TaxID=307972 RepID=A0A2G8K3I9_STIJA|nr:alpha 2,8-sialyltransferase ST8Sia VI [Apostichopus japonicus]